MISLSRAARNTALVMAFAGVASTFLAQPASAHDTGWSKTRSNCKYSGGVSTSHSYAWTQKESGSCSGHAWLRIYFNPDNINEYWEDSDPTYVSRSYPGMWHVYHKSQSSESWGQSH